MDLRRKLLTLFIAVAAGICHQGFAQNVAIKTNILSDAILNPNAGIEIGLAPRWTLEVEGEFNGWNLSHDRRWKHWAAQPEVRYWFCDRFGGHFIGVHAHGGQYNIGGIDLDFKILGTDFSRLKDSRFQGWFVGGGVSYGYDWVLSRHLNLEAEIGVGYSYTRFDQFQCEGCGKRIAVDQPHHYWGITRLAFSLVYVF